ncbi:hypothetical protein BS47DRAFT_1386567 [Hydnum rufescens UP504]|uniref:Uncharacterized protein n=1 Tax=Hydnum rufescens UP504 TaxID=1448309 RepID=A0A9P6DL12_9AGAM|nr:hypothetical protein BS47DRAFT_1386567 [Hydnum rufescens UP504]
MSRKETKTLPNSRISALLLEQVVMQHIQGPSRKGKPQGKEPRSRRPPKVKGGQRPGPQPTGNKPRRPRTKLHGEEADIARQIARQLLAEVERCDEHHLPDVHRLECGPCYRKKLDRGQKDDRLYVRPELNALVFTATSEGRARSPDRVTTDMSLIPDNLNHVRSTLEAHHGSCGKQAVGTIRNASARAPSVESDAAERCCSGGSAATTSLWEHYDVSSL